MLIDNFHSLMVVGGGLHIINIKDHTIKNSLTREFFITMI